MFHLKQQTKPLIKSASFHGQSVMVKRNVHVGSPTLKKGAFATIKHPSVSLQEFSRQLVLGYAEDAYREHSPVLEVVGEKLETVVQAVTTAPNSPLFYPSFLGKSSRRNSLSRSRGNSSASTDAGETTLLEAMESPQTKKSREILGRSISML